MDKTAKIWKDLFIYATNEWDFKQDVWDDDEAVYGLDVLEEFYECSRSKKHIKELKKTFERYARSQDWDLKKAKVSGTQKTGERKTRGKTKRYSINYDKIIAKTGDSNG